jgi:hypothetical protein
MEECYQGLELLTAGVGRDSRKQRRSWLPSDASELWEVKRNDERARKHAESVPVVGVPFFVTADWGITRLTVVLRDGTTANDLPRSWGPRIKPDLVSQFTSAEKTDRARMVDGVTRWNCGSCLMPRSSRAPMSE